MTRVPALNAEAIAERFIAFVAQEGPTMGDDQVRELACQIVYGMRPRELREASELPALPAQKALTVVMLPDTGAAQADECVARIEDREIVVVGPPSIFLHQLRLRVARDPALLDKIVVYALLDGKSYHEIALTEGGVFRWPVGFEQEAMDIELAIIDAYHERKTTKES
jgi:hypothetical protein